jgi:hypothetical protein
MQSPGEVTEPFARWYENLRKPNTRIKVFYVQAWLGSSGVLSFSTDLCLRYQNTNGTQCRWKDKFLAP